MKSLHLLASLLGSDGTPVRWEFRHISSKENEELRDANTIEVQVTGKPNLFRPKLITSKYLMANDREVNGVS